MKLDIKPDLHDLALRIKERGLESSAMHIEDTITEMLLSRINPSLEAWTEEVLELLQDMESTGPRNKAEYDEKIGFDNE